MVKIISSVLPALLTLLTPDVLKRAVDAMLDVIEDSVKDSKNKIDDVLVLPITKLLRNTFDVPDND